jgi:hypothetical protein
MDSSEDTPAVPASNVLRRALMASALLALVGGTVACEALGIGGTKEKTSAKDKDDEDEEDEDEDDDGKKKKKKKRKDDKPVASAAPTATAVAAPPTLATLFTLKPEGVGATQAINDNGAPSGAVAAGPDDWKVDSDLVTLREGLPFRAPDKLARIEFFAGKAGKAPAMTDQFRQGFIYGINVIDVVWEPVVEGFVGEQKHAASIWKGAGKRLGPKNPYGAYVVTAQVGGKSVYLRACWDQSKPEYEQRIIAAIRSLRG